MKSILQEGSSVFKAVEKAWNEAGKPQDFSVKILEIGKKNFLGFTKCPAIISLLYDIRSVTEPKKVRPESFRKGRQRPSEQAEKKIVQDRREPDLKQKVLLYHSGWTDELAEEFKGWVQEIMSIMSITVPYTVSFDRFLLRITFKNTLLDRKEEEGKLFASFSYLLLQGLKKKHKNKFKGFRIALTTPR